MSSRILRNIGPKTENEGSKVCMRISPAVLEVAIHELRREELKRLRMHNKAAEL